MHLKSLLMVAGLLTSSSLLAETWTGAQDGRWTNAANWAEGSVPGFTSEATELPDAYPELRLTTRAIFDGANLTGNKVTTIDLDGLVDIAYIEFDGDTAFTLGTGLDQKLPIEVDGALAVLGTKAPVLNATLLKCACCWHAFWDGQPRPGVSLTNNAPEELVVPGFAGWTGAKSPSEVALWLAGSGTTRLTGTVETSPTIHLFARQSSGGKTVIDTSFGVREFVNDRTTAYVVPVEITANGDLYSSVPTYGFLNLVYGSKTLFYGDGEVIFTGGRYDPASDRWHNTPELVSGSVVFETRVSARCTTYGKPADFTPGYALMASVNGSYEFLSDNFSTGLVEVACGTLKTAQIGQANVAGAFENASRIGFGDILLTGAGRIFYNGAGEESDKPIVLADSVTAYTTAKPSYSTIGVVEQAGTGLLRMTSPVRVDCASATLQLASSVETPAEWAGVLADTDTDHVLGLEKTGTGAWTLSAANTYTGPTKLSGGVLRLAPGGSVESSSELVFAGGTLEIPDAETEHAVTLPAVKITANSTLKLGVNTSVTFAAPARTAGTLDVQVVEMPATVKVTGLAAGDAPAYITFNGKKAVVGADGSLAPDGVVYWKSAANGDWSAAEKWTPGVPKATDNVLVTVAGGSYAVTVDDDLTQPATLTVRNRQQGETATVTVADGKKVDASGSLLELEKGARYVLGEGSRYDFDNSAKVDRNCSAPFMTVADGAEFRIAGGTASFTNFSGKITVGGADGDRPSLFSVTNGTLVLMPRNDPNGVEELQVLPGGRFEASGDARVEYATHHDGGYPFNVCGGTAEFSGNSVLYGSHGTNTVAKKLYSCRYRTGTGETVFRDNAQLDANYGAIDAYFYVRGDNSGETATLTFRDHARMARTRTGAKYGYLYVGGNGTHGVVNLASDQSHTAQNGNMTFYTVYVGAESGTGELNVSDGSFYPGSCGFYVGTRAGTSVSSTDSQSTGVVNLSGGMIWVVGSAALSPAWGCAVPFGTRVGDGYLAMSNRTHRLFGRLNVSESGKFVNEQGYFWVGYGQGEGEVVQTGGSVWVNTNLTYYTSPADSYGGGRLYETNQVAAIGLAGGTGRVIVSNGIFAVGSPLYVGGVRTNEFVNLRATAGTYAMFTDYKDERVGYGDRHEAHGTLTVAGGTFLAHNPVYVGTDGSGTVEIGPSGTFTAPALVLSNQTASVARFVFGADGVGAATVKKLVIAEGAKLEVDLSAYAGKKANLRLIAAESVDGAFAESDITLTGRDARPELRDAVVVQDASGIRCRVPHGMLMLIR